MLGIIARRFTVLLLIVLVGIFAIYYWGRTLIYRPFDDKTMYPGIGENKEYFAGEVMADPKQGGRPIFDIIENVNKYSKDQYNVIVTPSGYELSYAVGKFVGWEDIEDSKDKYILLKVNDLTNKYRVGFEKSLLFNSSTPVASRIFVEKVKLAFSNQKKNEVVKLDKVFVSDFGFDNIKKLLRKGDAVVVTADIDPPSRAKRDEGGVYLVDSLVIRRADLLGINNL